MNTFNIQEHQADKAGLHYDLRIENGGVLESWAIRHWPAVRGAKRLAIRVADHPLEWAAFEGTIPEGYGKGTVRTYDEGVYEPIMYTPSLIKLRLNGSRIHGTYILKKWRDNQWLIIAG